jgi:pimeloyl-ACP methyl ester carboxylesterase
VKKIALIGTATGLMVTYLIVVGFVIPNTLLHPAQSLITETPADRGMVMQDIILTPADMDIEIQGWWLPADESKASLVYVHGANSNRQEIYTGGLELYEELNARGISVLTIDVRNHGHSDSVDTGMQFGRTERHDVTAAVDWVVQQNFDAPIFTMGLSMGGATVIHQAKNETRINGMILIDPVLDTRSSILNGIYAITGIPQIVMMPVAWSATALFDLPKEGAQALDIGKTITHATLLFQEFDDPINQTRYARELAKDNNNVELVIINQVDQSDPRLADAGRWGTHGQAFLLDPMLVAEKIVTFVGKHGLESN